MWIDAHCHLADLRIGADLDAFVNRSLAQGINGWIQGGVSSDDWARQKALKARLGPTLLTSFGLHPWWVVQASSAELESELKKLQLALTQADALGELGLDFSDRAGGKSKQPIQEEIFRRQLALNARKPLILHIVRAHDEALGILRKFAPFASGGLVHSFSASKTQAAEYMKLGFLLSISGAATKPGFQTLKKALSWIPSESLVVETDSPDQPPAGAVGLNEPANLLQIAKAIADLRETTPEAILDQSAKNLRKLFKI